LLGYQLLKKESAKLGQLFF